MTREQALQEARHLMNLPDNSVQRSDLMAIYRKSSRLMTKHQLRFASKGDRYVVAK